MNNLLVSPVTYGTDNNDMGITAVGNINKTPGLGLTQGWSKTMMISTLLI